MGPDDGAVDVGLDIDDLFAGIIGDAVRLGCMGRDGAIGGDWIRTGGVGLLRLPVMLEVDCASSIRSPKPRRGTDRLPPGGGEMNGKFAEPPAFGALGGGSNEGASGEGGAGHRLPLVADASFKRLRVRLWSRDARLA